MIQTFLIVLGLAWIIFAVLSDIKTNEIPDWLNVSLVIFALGARFFYGLFVGDGSAESGIDFAWFYQGLIGLGVFFILGNVLYLGRMFAGGDAKLMMALGAVLPLTPSFMENIDIAIVFFVLFVFVGAVYGILSTGVLAFSNRKKFVKGFKKLFKKHKNKIYGAGFFALFLMAIGFSEINFFYFGIFVFVLPYFYLTARVVDEYFMVKKVSPGKLQEGDWLYKEVAIGKRKKLKPSWEGLSKKDIEKLKKRGKKVWIRSGIPFSPVFLVSFMVLVYFLKTGIYV